MTNILTPDELNNLKIRQMILQQKQTEMGIFRNEYQGYFSAVLEAHGCEKDKQYQISLETGAISEVAVKSPSKEEPKDKLKEIKK